MTFLKTKLATPGKSNLGFLAFHFKGEDVAFQASIVLHSMQQPNKQISISKFEEPARPRAALFGT
jgi:hypothetical protein